MKYCPSCRTNYNDDALQFCLQDGTPLVKALDAGAPTIAFNAEEETIVAPKKVEPIRFDLPSSYQTNQTNWETSQPVIIERAPKKSNTAKIVALSVLGTILLLGLGGLGAWLYFSNKKTEVAVNVNAATQNRPANLNATINQTANANLATPTPTATPTVQPTLKPEAVKAISNDVKDVIDQWKDSTENLELDAHVNQYAATVDYYRAGRVNVERVRADRERAFTTYDSLSVNIENVKVTPDASGEKATVVFDKEWNFEGFEKISSGKVQQQLTFGKFNGKWKITGEKDLKVYYSSN